MKLFLEGIVCMGGSLKLKAMKSILRIQAEQVRSIFGINREMLKKYISEILFFENTTQKGKIWR